MAEAGSNKTRQQQGWMWFLSQFINLPNHQKYAREKFCTKCLTSACCRLLWIYYLHTSNNTQHTSLIPGPLHLQLLARSFSFGRSDPSPSYSLNFTTQTPYLLYSWPSLKPTCHPFKNYNRKLRAAQKDVRLSYQDFFFFLISSELRHFLKTKEVFLDACNSGSAL